MALQWHGLWRAIAIAYGRTHGDTKVTHWLGNGSEMIMSAQVYVTGTMLRAAVRGRVGLALSGGGMRAAFLHLGMLARLAECDMLRDIETLSCVSGGSIVGSHLFLLIKELQESKVCRVICDI